MKVTLMGFVFIFSTVAQAYMTISQGGEGDARVNGVVFDQFFDNSGIEQRLDENTRKLLERVCRQASSFQQDLGNNIFTGTNTIGKLIIVDNHEGTGFYVKCIATTPP